MAAWSKKLSTHAITPEEFSWSHAAPLEFDSAATRSCIIPNSWTWNKLAAAQIYAREPGIHAREESAPRHGAAAENQYSSRTSPRRQNKHAHGLLARAFCSSNRRRTIALSVVFMDENCSSYTSSEGQTPRIHPSIHSSIHHRVNRSED